MTDTDADDTDPEEWDLRDHAAEYECEGCGYSVDLVIDDPYYHESPMWCNDCDARMRTGE